MIDSSAQFPESSFSYLAACESTHWWFRARSKLILWALRRNSRNTGKMLEVGCGTGFVTKAIASAFPDIQLEASEFFEQGLRLARARVPRCSFFQLDILKMHIDSAYESIGCFDVLEHIQADELALQKLYCALKPDGILIITVPQHKWLWSSTDVHARHARRYTSRELRRKVLDAGFTVRYKTSFVSLLLPVMALSRAAAGSKNYDPDKEFKISSFLNYMLNLTMELEFLFIRLGIRFPLGGSLLLVAKKS